MIEIKLSIMLLKRTLLLVLIIVWTGTVSGIDVSVEESCSETYEPMASIENTDGGKIAEKDHYTNQVCVNDVDYMELSDECIENEQMVFTMDSRTDANFSIYDNGYGLKVCSPEVRSTVRNSCLSEESKVLSVESDNNSLVAAPSYTDSTYDQSLCLSINSAENITLSLTGLTGSFYSEGIEINTGDSRNPSTDYPYIVDEQPKGVVGYGDVLRLSRPSSEKASIVQRADSGGFLLPFTAGGHQEIEDEQDRISNGNFLDLVSPNFGYTSGEAPMIKVRYKSPHKIDGFSGRFGIGYSDLRIRNRGIIDQDLTIDMAPY